MNITHAQPKTGDECQQAFEIVTEIFTYAPWNDAQKEAGHEVVEALKTAYMTIVENVPPCPTRTRALNNLIDARMLANAAITHGGKY